MKLNKCAWHDKTPKLLSRKVKIAKEGGYVTVYAVVCTSCYKKPRWYCTVKEAVSMWNRNNSEKVTIDVHKIVRGYDA